MLRRRGELADGRIGHPEAFEGVAEARRPRGLKRLVIVLAVLAAISLGAPVASARGCNSNITPGENIARAAAGCPASTTFTIRDGSYRLSGAVNAQSGDVFRGTHSDGSRPVIDVGRSKIGFEVGRTNRVRISGLRVYGADGSNRCAPGCGKAISGNGTRLHVSNVRLHHNANQGIGGVGFGFVLTDSEIDHNGSYQFTAMDRKSRAEPSSAAGIKLDTSGYFARNRIHHNYWNGLWCDDKGGPIKVYRNRIYNNGKTGIQYETCNGGSKIQGNYIARNGYVKPGYRTARAGILLQDPRGLEVSRNTISGHPGYGIYAVKGGRQRIGAVRIHHNRLIGDRMKACYLSGIACR